MKRQFSDRPSEVTIAMEKLPRAPDDDGYRAVHRIRLSALQHNYMCVEQAANRQQCSVIAVVKADAYGHGAIATALYLADVCGADAFAVATLEEGIALRKAFEHNPPGRWSKQLAAAFHTIDAQHVHADASVAPWSAAAMIGASASSGHETATSEATARITRPTRIRILVLGPPIGFPRCFDEYYHHNIEVMVSGPEVAAALLAWVADENVRRRTEVERSAIEMKAKALYHPNFPRDLSSLVKEEKKADLKDRGGVLLPHHCGAPVAEPPAQVPRFHSSTLGNVSGQDLAREVKALLIQKASCDAMHHHHHQQLQPHQHQNNDTKTSNTIITSCGSSTDSNPKLMANAISISCTSSAMPMSLTNSRSFVGIEQAARLSRNRTLAETSLDNVDTPGTSHVDSNSSALRRVLRWHAVVESGMGRLGFRTEPLDANEDRKDTVEIIKELVDCETRGCAPIEFYGMCTHMADANSTSDYTHSQIDRFLSLLDRVRTAGIAIPTISTDNSAALLTTELTHFDPSKILAQRHANSRGYVRTGGAIYGQRPAFPQLRAVSTLLASVRHVAVLKKNESVGYDRAYTAPYDVRIATLTIGFADGYPRELGNGVGKVAIHGSVFPVVGNVCMDMMMIELGPADDLSCVGASVAVRDIAVLWGPYDDDNDEGLVRLQDLATTLNTTQSALTCGLDKIRVRRQFI